MSSTGSRLTSSGLAGFVIPNGKIVATVAGNNLTVAIKTAAGNDASTTDPLYVAFRSIASSGAAFEGRAITSEQSIVLPNGANTGQGVGSVPFRIWVALVDDNGTLRIGLQNCSNTNIIRPLSELVLATSTLVGAGSNTMGTLYTAGAAVTSMPLRIVGYLEWSSGLATGGVWDVAPDIIEMYHVGVSPPGGVVQEQLTHYSLVQGGSTTIPFDDSIPLVSEGNALNDTLSITPKSKVNLIEFGYHATASYSTAAHIIVAMFKTGDGTNAAAAEAAYAPGADELIPLNIEHVFQANSLSAITFTMRAGGSTAGTVTMSGTASNRMLGGAQRRFLRAREIMG